MKENTFTFAVLVYNQFNIVVETLESIKYQIERYGQDYVFKIIITDDASKDNSLYVINKWIERNKDLFKETKIISNTNNVGTVKNYNKIMENIGNEPFKLIAGDDLIGPNNIFKQIGKDEKTLDTFPFYRLENGIVDYRKDYVYDYFYRYKFYSPSKNVTWMKNGDFIHTPSTFYYKKLYSISGAGDYNKKFYLFEDDPSFYCFFKNISDSKVNFHCEPLILYRYSVSSTSTVPNKKFLKDWRKLQNQYIMDSHGWNKFFYKFRMQSDFSKKITLYKICLKVKKMYRMVKIRIFYNEEFKQFFECYKKDINKFQEFYNIISKRNSKFLEEIKGNASD